MKEMDENAEYYADQFLHRSTSITEVDSLSLSVNPLLMQALGKGAVMYSHNAFKKSYLLEEQLCMD